MGNLNVTKLVDKKAHANYIHHLTNDIRALDKMLADGLIEKEPIRIGAEQEFCLVNNAFFPNNNALDILKDIDDDHFTTEIGLFNLEINLDPLELKTNCFSKLKTQLVTLLDKAKKAASKHDTKILLTGILPTLTLKQTLNEYMTPKQRYFTLSEAIRESRKQEFNIHIKGVDDLNIKHDSIMLEGCNTSFQMHLQVNPDKFIDTYNWAQAISGHVLSICTNSPLLFGKELWDETRIALFTQSVDTRANSFLLNEKQSRVSFGEHWETGTITDIFKDNISRFRSLVSTEYIKDSIKMLEKGDIPKLKALNLHNGTVYRWNRVCYGVGNGKPHLRIENRYIPSGPTVDDEIANMMFWVGLMVGKPKQYNDIHKRWDFKDVKSNFFSAARYGMATQFYWNGNYISAQELILDELLPMAYKGLYSVGIDPKDAEKYLTIIRDRVNYHNGSQWIKRSYRNLQKTYSKFESAQIIVENMYNKQEHNYPIGSWRLLDSATQGNHNKQKCIKHIMKTKIFSVAKNDSLQLVINIMKWKNIHHVPVINNKTELVGLVSWTEVIYYSDDEKNNLKSVEDVMIKDVITINEYDDVILAKKRMTTNNINCLPVVRDNKLIGIITNKDVENL